MLNSVPILAQVQVDIPVFSAAAAIVVLGLLIYGLRDVLRLSVGRIWAISGVCFRDAIRRRVLWITPLAMLGVVIVVQLQKPLDEQDAIRLTTKFCFFATALVVTIIAVITAATNLPREIENRVIYTIVTKPVTRLEIVFGKILGFARVSGAILLVMGIFSLGYLHLRSWTLGRQISQTLQNTSQDNASREWLEHYSQTGLLVSRHLTRPEQLGQYARVPEGDRRWIVSRTQSVAAQFMISPDAQPAGVVLHVAYERAADTPADAPPPAVQFSILDPREMSLVVSGEQIGMDSIPLLDPQGKQTIPLQLPPERIEELLKLPAIVVSVTGITPGVVFGFDPNSIGMLAVDASEQVQMKTSPLPLLYAGNSGREGQQLRGPGDGEAPVAVFEFRNTTPTILNGKVPFEMVVNLERSGDDAEEETATRLEMSVRDRTTGVVSPLTWVYPESNRTVFFALPAEHVPTGDFDLLVRNSTVGHVAGITANSVLMVTRQEYFGFNLFKGLLVLWLFSILVSSIAFCCSTFLSWPIAVVLTL
ncbi:MAG TPA: ABC transporter permease subunit, partial [Tepidisphaeraceae bacterium]